MTHLRLSLAVVLACCWFVPARAQEPADPAKQLMDLGAQVQQAGGMITQVSFKDCSKLGRPEFELISSVATLKKLTLYGSCKGLNDDTLPLLKKLTNLEELNCDGIMVTDDGLKPLGEIPSLVGMSFFHPSWGSKEFVGSGCAHFASLPKLDRLTIAGSPFNDTGMAAVAKLTQLTAFRTWHTFQTEAGNKHLLALTKLKSLRLGQRLRKYDGKPNPPSLSDETIEVVAQLKTLETLELDEAKFSLAALTKLKTLPNLKKIVLERIDISEADVEQLCQQLPNAKIELKPLTDEQRVALEKMLKP